jgi:hypothetical protein
MRRIGMLLAVVGLVAGWGPSVSQFWTYDPKKFLEQPVYSREFPPCRHC